MTLNALDFALKASPAPEPAPLPVQDAVPTPVLPDEAQPFPSAMAFAAGQTSLPERPIQTHPDVQIAAILGAGHTLYVYDGHLYITKASTLTDDQRALLRAHKDALFVLAEPWPLIKREPITTWPVQTLFASEPSLSAPSLAQFLGTSLPPSDWRPDEIPSLDGIHDIVLNFATNGLDWAHGDRPIGLTVSTLDGKLVRFLPFAFKGGGNLSEDHVKEFVRREIRGKHITNSNTRFDLHQSREWGVDLEEQGNTFSDIQHTAALLDDHRKRFSIDILAHDYLGGIEVERIDEEHMAEYSAAEVAEREKYTAQLVGQLRDVMYPKIDEEELRDVQNLEDQVIPAVVEMEKNGAPIDMELLEQYSIECNKRHDALLWEIAQEVGFSFDHTPTSWQRLFERCGIGLTLLESEKATFAEDILNKIEHPLIQKAHLSSQLASLNSKIFKPYKEMIGPDGILRFDIHQLRSEEGGTVTGRFSAGFIQQVPNHGNHFAVFGNDLFPRRLYIPREGEYLEADAMQIQYRIFAHHANNPRIMKMYADDPAASFHKMIMKLLIPFKPDLNYEYLKTMNFMIIFGGKLIKIAVMMGYINEVEGKKIRELKTQWTDPRLAPAREIQAIYAREIPEVDLLLKMSSHLAMTECDDWCNKSRASQILHQKYKHRGFVKTVLGRRSRFPKNYKLHKAFCMVDQGSEGDIMKTKIVQLHKERKHTGFLMRQTVHDSVGGDALLPETKARVSEILNQQSFPQIRVPILFDVNSGPTWAACKG